MPLTPSQTRALLQSLGHRPRKPLGQNFLIDGNIVRKSLHVADLVEGDTVVEIGPGLGTLTEALLEEGCRVHAVEIDPVLSQFLKDSFMPRYEGRFHLLEADAVSHPRANLPASITSFKVVANLPYAITSPWLERVLEHPLPSDLVLMMQKEAADRITSRPGRKNFGAISVFTGLAFEKAGLHRVSRTCFYPVPGVDSLLLHLKRKADAIILPLEIRTRIRQIFTKRRKKISGLLSGQPELREWMESLPQFNCSAEDRPEMIPPEAWASFGIRRRPSHSPNRSN